MAVLTELKSVVIMAIMRILTDAAGEAVLR